MDETREIVARPVPSGVLPSDEEQEKHSHLHFPCQSWCAIRLKAKAKDDGHYAKKQDEIFEDPGKALIIQLDYTFIESIKILTLFFVNKHVGAATQVATKGPEASALKWAERVLQMWGVQDYALRSGDYHRGGHESSPAVQEVQDYSAIRKVLDVHIKVLVLIRVGTTLFKVRLVL